MKVLSALVVAAALALPATAEAHLFGGHKHKYHGVHHHHHFFHHHWHHGYKPHFHKYKSHHGKGYTSFEVKKFPCPAGHSWSDKYKGCLKH